MNKRLFGKIEQAMGDYQEIRKKLNATLIINGKSLKEWHKVFFSVRIPKDATPIECKILSLEILRLNQIASSYFTAASARLSSIQHSSESIYRDKYRELVLEAQSSNSKMPAASYLEIMSKQETDSAQALAMIAEIEKNFWRDILNYISRCRKQLENITMNNALHIKTEVTADSPGGTNYEPEESDEDEREYPWDDD